MSESDSKNEAKEREQRFSQEQQDMLLRCSEKKDMTEWNEWRKKNPDEDIFLDKRNFHGWCLSGAFLNTGAVVINPGTSLHEQWFFRGQVYLRGSVFLQAKLHDTDFRGAHLEGAMFNSAELEGGCLELACLQRACLLGANLQGVDLSGAELQGADFSRAIVDGSTLIWTYKIDHKTKFEGVGLDAARVYPATKQLLEYNIRRMNWEDWYKEHWLLRWSVRWFWHLTNYGLSTWRVIIWFFVLAFLFAAVYMNWAYWRPPGLVSNLEVQPEIGEAALHYFVRAPVRAVYFSIVTMTTLGFGDMYANKGSIVGHVILAVQVILGYVLLGALITRFAVLFTAGGPAGKFAGSRKGPGSGSGVSATLRGSSLCYVAASNF